MKVYNQKAFVIDKSTDLEIPQTFLLSEPITARYIRLYPTSFVNTSAPCMRFELLGCRTTEKENLANYEVTLDQDWTILFDVPNIQVNHPQVISSFGYPKTYAQNTFYKWNITLIDGPVFLQFVDISLRVYEESEFQNNMGCRDTIIVSDFDIINPLTHIKEYFMNVNKHTQTYFGIRRIYVLLNSDDNGRIVGVPQADDEVTPLYLGLLSCSDGKLAERGRGFRAYVALSELPVCWSGSSDSTSCKGSSMELISPAFLGMYDISPEYRYTFLFESPHHDVIMIKITDFDISCYADSVFQMVAEPGDIQYCNKNVVYEEQFYMAKLFHIHYSKYTLENCENSVFPEGFGLVYKMIPDTNLNPTFVEEDSHGHTKKEGNIFVYSLMHF
ncbi:uncharacterized protein LOC123526773 [Mercenaria mercenaria]|uniref:uncharacterized protein LOC123526773 n=1 Tax=Mercenaria mercenaria TaxID=6596 RepID=UPI00234F122F|nr:uncharacterized protein LOC123526773 [Mercenaria mercenaria]